MLARLSLDLVEPSWLPSQDNISELGNDVKLCGPDITACKDLCCRMQLLYIGIYG